MTERGESRPWSRSSAIPSARCREHEVSREGVVDQVRGILDRYEINFHIADTGRQFLARFGSAGVFIDVADDGDRTIVVVHAPILQELELADDARPRLLERLNQVNESSRYVKVYVRESIIHAECALLADDLQATDLMNAVYTIAEAADQLDDELAQDFGGKTFEAKWNESDTERPVDT
jgi:hypothetical protein